LAYRAGKIGGTMTTVLNASNEVAVEMFLNKKISFTMIPKIIQKIMSKHRVIKDPTYAQIISTDNWAREEALQLC